MPPVPNWKVLDPVPERAIEISNADHSAVYVRTESGKIYGCNPDGATKNCWVEAHEPLVLAKNDRRIPVGENTHPPKGVVSSVGLDFDPIPEAGAQVYYALLSDGSVWRWRNFGPHTLMGILGWLLSPGIAMGIFALFVPVYLGAGIFHWMQRAASAPSAQS